MGHPLQESNAHAHYSRSAQTPRIAHARPHPALACALRRSPGDRGKRLGVDPRLPARLSGKQVTLLWGRTGPQGPAFGTRRRRPSVRTEFKLSPLTARKELPEGFEGWA